MNSTAPLLETIEPDEPSVPLSGKLDSAAKANAPTQIVLTPTNRTQPLATTQSDAESGIAGIFRQSAHPFALFFLFFFRISAITVYILCGYANSFVLSVVVVVVLLAMDFWNCRNVAGRKLVGLRFWNQVDEDGESYWVFESRDPSRPPNPIDSKMFWIAVYVFPLFWVVLLIWSFVRFNLVFIPIVVLALVFNITTAIGFTYADRNAKERWARTMGGSGWNMGLGSIGGQIISGAVQRGVGKVFG